MGVCGRGGGGWESGSCGGIVPSNGEVVVFSEAGPITGRLDPIDI